VSELEGEPSSRDDAQTAKLRELVPPSRGATAEVDVFFPTEEELRAISGRDDLEEALRSFEGVRVAAKLGAAGAAILEEGALLQVSALKVDAVDTTGAGDSFDVGFLHAWIRRNSRCFY
jgi:sugar/nucleoside kinase (ribokinase family)